MKKMISFLLVFFLLSGCSSNDSTLKPALQLREKLLTGSGCSFNAVVTADYEDHIYTFQMDCAVDEKGNLKFCVTKPETIEGISGTIDGSGGKLSFDEYILAFPGIVDDNTTPVMAPWIFINSLRSGYIISVAETDEYHIITVNDSYEDDALELDVWVNKEGDPRKGEILYRGKRFLSVDVSNFRYL